MIYENKSDMNCDDHFFIFEVYIVKSINALCIIVRDSEIPYDTQDEKNETQHPQFTMEGRVHSSVLKMYKLACDSSCEKSRASGIRVLWRLGLLRSPPSV